jgi:LuxR family maltose regulon positive regulatory protein
MLPSTLVEALVHETTVAAYADDRFAANKALQSAVELAEPRDLLRPFVHAGPGVRELPRSALLESVLSRCELVVLSMLSMPSSLQSMDEIAADLMVSINTVKSHVRSIYSKLGASSRRSAVLAAHEQGLFCAPTWMA